MIANAAGVVVPEAVMWSCSSQWGMTWSCLQTSILQIPNCFVVLTCQGVVIDSLLAAALLMLRLAHLLRTACTSLGIHQAFGIIYY